MVCSMLQTQESDTSEENKYMYVYIYVYVYVYGYVFVCMYVCSVMCLSMYGYLLVLLYMRFLHHMVILNSDQVMCSNRFLKKNTTWPYSVFL